MKWFYTRTLLGACAFLILIALLLLLDHLCYTQALPLDISIQQDKGLLKVDDQTISLGTTGTLTTLRFVEHDSVVHEYQLDGTDSTNNFTLDASYLQRLSSTPYYRFQAWMRDLDGLSRWRDLQIWSGNTLLSSNAWPATGLNIDIPRSESVKISLRLQRPETPMQLQLIAENKLVTQITLDRNNRQIAVARQEPGLTEFAEAQKSFFPLTPLPFAAMLIDTVLRVLIWSLLLLGAVFLIEFMLLLFSILLQRILGDSYDLRSQLKLRRVSVFIWQQRLGSALHPLAWVALGISFCFVAWIAYVQYHALPHIYDASAYYFAAKMYALGRISVPLPAAVEHFPGPFMVQANGQWFGQYAPGTALTLVPGIWIGLPWLVEPLLGTLALLGIGLIAARLFDRKVATLAVILGTLSPFYSYQAASYLSHTIALFYLVWGLWGLLRFAQGGSAKNLVLAALAFGMAGLTRDLVSVLYVLMFLPGVLALTWEETRHNWRRWILPGGSFCIILLAFFGLTLLFNQQLTGSPWLSPRTLFFAGDRWGFGPGVGFYGQHTLAAGLVNLDELLTILAIDLFGWPFYITFAFLPLPFLTLRARLADWLLLAWLCIGIGAYAGYFYHGIYLGPRYLFETLPFLLLLTARGILCLNDWVLTCCTNIDIHLFFRPQAPATGAKRGLSLGAVALVIVLLCCNVGYFLPRQLALHQDYNGLPNGYHVKLESIYQAPLHKAIVVTGDYTIYQFILFPLNDPLLQGDVIYALASTTNDYSKLLKAYPGRTLYQLNLTQDGTALYQPITVVRP